MEGDKIYQNLPPDGYVSARCNSQGGEKEPRVEKVSLRKNRRPHGQRISGKGGWEEGGKLGLGNCSQETLVLLLEKMGGVGGRRKRREMNIKQNVT